MASLPSLALYDAWRSAPCYRVRIALHFKGLEYETLPVDLTQRETHTPDFLARNPQGTVPVLVVGDRHLTQSLAILEYLEELCPEPALMPPDPMGRARVRGLMQAIALEIQTVSSMRVANRVAEAAQGGDEVKMRWFHETNVAGMADLEKLLQNPATGRFCHGDIPSLADCCLAAQVINAKRFEVDFSPYPKTMEIFQTCMELPSFADTQPERVGPSP